MKEYGSRIRLSPEEVEMVKKSRGVHTEPEGAVVLPRKIPKILLLDVETMPVQVFVWGLYKQRISHENVIADQSIVCWSAKWLYDPDVISDCMTSEETKTRDDKRIMQSLWRLLEDCDVVIAHNGLRFDLRKINARFLYHKIAPPSPYQVIDTLKATQKAFGTISHKLDYLGKYLLNKGKIETNFGLWKKCYYGDQESLDYMVAYNKEDVLLLEEVYLEVRSYIKPHPNFAILSEAQEPCCIYCGGSEFTEAGFYTTAAGRYATKRCTKCSGLMRERISDMTKEERKHLTISIAR